jgi:chromosome condensin MukBEF ATPase and DNA-binding subunit MukB
MMNDAAQNKLVEIKQQIDELVEPQKALENDIKMKRGALHVVKKLLRQLEKNV